MGGDLKMDSFAARRAIRVVEFRVDRAGGCAPACAVAAQLSNELVPRFASQSRQIGVDRIGTRFHPASPAVWIARQANRRMHRAVAQARANALHRQAADLRPFSSRVVRCSSSRNPLQRHVGEFLRNSLRAQQQIESYYATILYRESIAQTLRIGAITEEISQLAALECCSYASCAC